MSAAPRAGLRDATWAASPSIRGANAWHIEVDGHAACNSQMPLMPESLQPAAETFSDVRCKATGCANRWRDVPSRRYGESVLP